MKTIKRNQCVVTGEALTPLYRFKNFPVLSECTDDLNHSNDVLHDACWGFSPTGHVQLLDLVDPKILYSRFHPGGTVGNIWKQHHQKIFNLVNQDFYHNVLEIGSGSGELVKKFCKLDKNFTWVNIDPSILPQIEDKRIQYKTAFFEEQDFENSFDTIIHSHCFEHSYYPIKFLNKVNRALTDNGIQYISVPNMKYWIENNFTNALFFEHTFYLDFDVLEYMLAKTGFKIVDSIIEPHSIFVKTKKSNSIELPKTDFSYIKKMFKNYTDYLDLDIISIKEKIKKKSIFLFGAHSFSQTLFSLGLKSDQIINILDNDPTKENKRLYGTSCIIKSPKILLNYDSPIVLLRVGAYREEITRQILEINPKTVFV